MNNTGICLRKKALVLLLNDNFVFKEFPSRFPSAKLLLTVFHLILESFTFAFTVSRLTCVVIFGVIGFQDEQEVFIFIGYSTKFKLQFKFKPKFVKFRNTGCKCIESIII